MTRSERDIQRAVAIVEYCDEIALHLADYEMSEDVFEATRLYQLAINNLLSQIGEISVHLSPEFQDDVHNNKRYWADIRSFRNLATHHYERLDPQACYAFATQDVPRLREMLLRVPDVLKAYESSRDEGLFHSDAMDPFDA